MIGLKNRDFVYQSVLFKMACKLAGCEPTMRQASKFRNARKGKANSFRLEAQRALTDEAYAEVLKEGAQC